MNPAFRLFYFLCFIIFLILPEIAYSQKRPRPVPPAQGDTKEAKDNFTYENYRAALREYEALLLKEPDNSQYLYRAGVCYSKTSYDQTKAIKHLEKAIENKSNEKDAIFRLAMAYQYSYKFDEAIKYYQQGMTSVSDKELLRKGKRNIEMCNNAKVLVKKPVNATIETLGPSINSEDPDYYPLVDENESVMLFSTRRSKGNMGLEVMDGFFTADVFISTEKNGEWTKSKSMGGNVCTPFDEEAVGMTPDGDILFLSIQNMVTSGDIFYSERKGKVYQPPVPFIEPINTPFMEITAFLAEDRTALYFSSDRQGGFGGFDIYVSRKLPTGEWGPALNLGPNINTEWDEYFPQVSKDNKLLHFSSEGHNSMGGFDIFKSNWNEKDTIWEKPQNIGYPINTPDDDMHISFGRSGKSGYISSKRKGGMGDLDIYCVKFHDIEETQAVIRGRVVTMVPIDYNDYLTVYTYNNNGIIKDFPENYQPRDASWKLIKERKDQLKPGHEFSIPVVMEKNGAEKRFTIEKAPINDPSYILKDIKILQIPKKTTQQLQKKIKPTQTEVLVPDAFISVSEKTTDNLVGEYLPNPKTGKYIIIVPPGQYIVTITAEGYKETSHEINIIGKNSFQPEIHKDLVLKSLKEISPIHYTKIK